jgi:glycyl-tRNA synthetase
MPTRIDMAKFAKFCKDTGFIFQSSEIYGGINGFWDYGPLGVELKKNIKDAWWQDMVRNPPPGPDGQEIRMVGLDCSIIMNPKVWEASGHAAGFQDPMVDCAKCQKLFRADKVFITSIDEYPSVPITGAPSADRINLGYITFEADNATDANQSYEDYKTVMIKKRRFKHTPAEPHFVPATDTTTYPQRPCPDDKCDGQLSPPRAFNLMNETRVGAVVETSSKAWLRPETAQGIFANYRLVLNSTRLKLPFGIAQIGKSFRNEVTPRNFIFRSREFEQMEIEFFCHPDESRTWYEYWRNLRKAWYSTLGIKSENLKPREQGQDELAHYSVGTTDIEYMFPFSEEPQELEGVAHRGDFDLKAHAAKSGKTEDLMYFDEERWNNDSQALSTRSFKEWLKTNPPESEIAKYRFTPHVIEPSAGADRFALAVLCEAYCEDEVTDAKGNKETRIVMKFHPRLAPIKCAIFPLVNKDGMPEAATKIYRSLKPYYNVFYDDKGAVGRRYRRQDEIGTPFCVTVDGQTAVDGTVTLRDRDSMTQRRIPQETLRAEIERAMND